MTSRVGDAPAYSTDSSFWDWLVESGLVDGNSAYYKDPEGDIADDAGAYANAIEVAYNKSEPGSATRKELIDRLYREGAIEGADRDYWYNGTAETLGADMDNLKSATEDFFSGAGEGQAGAFDGIMGGGTLTRIVRQGQDPIWAMSYSVSGATHLYTFETEEQVAAALGADWATGGYTDIAESAVDSPDGTAFRIGSAASLVGQTEDYNLWFEDITNAAALRAGVRSPGKIGEYLADPEVQRIMATSVAGEWTPEQEQAELRRTDYYQNVLYPGISTIMASGKGGQNPEAVWWQYHDSVEDNLETLGYERDADGSYRNEMSAMLGAGISDTVFNTMAPNYLRASQDAEFASSLDYWLDKTAGRNVTFDDVFDALTGQTAGDLALAVESGIIQFQANMTSTSLSDEQISRIARMTEMHESEIKQSFNTAEENLLALGDQGLARYGLSEQALVSAAFGLEEGDQSAQEIRRLASKTIKELSAQDDKKAQFYTTFDQRKRPVREGLAAANPELG